jgi:hypothetical protein
MASDQALRNLEEAQDVTRKNMQNLLDRDAQIGQLEGKSNELQGATDQFQRQSRQLHWKTVWNSQKMPILLGAVVFLALVFLWYRSEPMKLFGAYCVLAGLGGAGYYAFQQQVGEGSGEVPLVGAEHGPQRE